MTIFRCVRRVSTAPDTHNFCPTTPTPTPTPTQPQMPTTGRPTIQLCWTIGSSWLTSRWGTPDASATPDRPDTTGEPRTIVVPCRHESRPTNTCENPRTRTPTIGTVIGRNASGAPTALLPKTSQ